MGASNHKMLRFLSIISYGYLKQERINQSVNKRQQSLRIRMLLVYGYFLSPIAMTLPLFFCWSLCCVLRPFVVFVTQSRVPFCWSHSRCISHLIKDDIASGQWYHQWWFTMNVWLKKIDKYIQQVWQINSAIWTITLLFTVSKLA